MKRRKFVFKVWDGTKIRVSKIFSGRWIYYEAHLPKGSFMFHDTPTYKDYESATRALQRYAKKYYGETAK